MAVNSTYESHARETEKGMNHKNAPKCEKARYSAAINAAIKDGNKKQALPDPCAKTELNKINIALHNFFNELKRIKGYGEFYINGTINKLQNITSLIRNTTKIISAVIKTLVSRLRDFLIDQIRKGIELVIDLILPTIAKSIKNTVIQQLIDKIFCKFKDIIKGLANLVGDFLFELIGKMVNAPFCAAQQFTNALINNIAAVVDSAVGPILNEITDILGGVTSIVGNIFQALDFILGLENFLCDPPNCPEVNEFKASPWAGPSKAEVDAFDSFLAPLGGRQTPTAESIIGDATQFIDGIEIFGKKLGDSAGTIPSSIANCNTDPFRCGPPTVEFFGGGGAGAVGELIVDNIGKTIGVSLKSGGSGYTRPPFITFTDSCEDTFLSAYTIINDDGEVIDVVITTPVVVHPPDGTREIDFPPPPPDDDPIVDPEPPLPPPVQPPIIVEPPPPIIVEPPPPPPPPPGGGPEEPTPPPPGLPLDFPPGEVDDDDDNPFENDYVVCLKGFRVKDTGIGYTTEDSIEITPNIQNLSANVRITEEGQIIAIDIAEQIFGIPEYPEIEIDSDTGVGAIIEPILSFIPINEYDEDEDDDNIFVEVQAEIFAGGRDLLTGSRDNLITTLRGRKLITERQEFTRRDVIRIVDCISGSGRSNYDTLVGYVNGQPYYGTFHIHPLTGVKMVGAIHTNQPHEIIYNTREESLNSLQLSSLSTQSSNTPTTTSTITPTPTPTTTITPTTTPTSTTTTSPTPSSSSPSSGGGY